MIVDRNRLLKIKINGCFNQVNIFENVFGGRIWSALYKSFRCCGCQFVLDCNTVQRCSVVILWSVISANFIAFHKRLPAAASCLANKRCIQPLSGSLHGAEIFKPRLLWTFHFLPVALSKIHHHYKYYHCALSVLVGCSFIDKTWKNWNKISINESEKSRSTHVWSSSSTYWELFLGAR